MAMMIRNGDIDEAVWARAKARAAKEGRPMIQVIRLLVEHYAKHGLPELPRPATPKK